MLKKPYQKLVDKFKYKILKWLKVKPIGVFVIVKDDQEKCLVVLHSHGMKKYSNPGGKLEKGELYSEGAIREALEETGLHIKITRLVGLFRLRLDEGDVILYEGRVIGGHRILTSSETSHCDFFTVTSLKSMHKERRVYNAQLSAIMWAELPPRKDGLPHEGWLTIPPSPIPESKEEL